MVAVVVVAAAVAAALIRVRRYEIIKLGLDGGEGDGMAREHGGRVERARVPGALDVGGDGTLDGAETRPGVGGIGG